MPVLSFATATFGGGNEFFKAWGSADVAEARRLLEICLEAGVNFFDTANIYSQGMAEEILGQALEGRRHEALLGTKATFPMSDAPNDFGSSRLHLLEACEDSLRRLKTDYINVYYLRGFDDHTPVQETLRILDDLVPSGKARRGQPVPASSRLQQGSGQGPDVPDELQFTIVDVLDELAEETGKTVARTSLNWPLQRPTVTSLVFGARNEEQLRQNLGQWAGVSRLSR